MFTARQTSGSRCWVQPALQGVHYTTLGFARAALRYAPRGWYQVTDTLTGETARYRVDSEGRLSSPHNTRERFDPFADYD